MSKKDINNKIIYLRHNQINKTKWDKCIDRAVNGLIYGYSFYLDIVCKHWDGLVMNDYEKVMPITWNRKYGIFYLYQPFFTSSLGIFGNKFSSEVIQSFLENIPQKFIYRDIYLNYANLYHLPGFELYERTNLVLDLNNRYENIAASFSKNHIRSIKKAELAGCYMEKNITIKKVIKLAQVQSKKISSIGSNDYNNFLKLHELLLKQDNAITYGVYSKGEKLLSACAFFFSHNRAYFILAGNHPESRSFGASHFLINAFIKENCGEKLLLDFEGSNIKSVARFYKGFGAREELYAGLKLNNLPAIFKLFKK